MPTEPEPLTMAEAVRRAVEACDDGSNQALDDLMERFEDDDEPIAAIEDIEQRLDETLGPPFDDDDPAFTMARAAIIYLAHRRDEVVADAEELLRLTARAEFDGHPPPAVKSWLDERHVSI